MTIQDLIYFNSLAKTFNFTKTAEAFYVSQPSISMALKRLEKELDTVLIERNSIRGQLQLTEAGKVLLKYSSEILDRIDWLKEDIERLTNKTVDFGLLPSIGGSFMKDMRPYLSKFSNALRFVEEESSDTMLDLVGSGKVPIAIIGSDKADFEYENLLQIHLVTKDLSFWASSDHQLASKKWVTIEDVKDEVLISLSHGYTHYRIFEEWIEDNFLNRPKVFYTKEIQTALSFASSSNNLCFLIDTLVPDDHNLVRIPIKNPPKFYISLIVSQDMTMSSHQKKFNNNLIKFAHSYSENKG